MTAAARREKRACNKKEAEITDSSFFKVESECYTRRVVGNGVRAQSTNPEVKVKGEDPIINQIIDKLKHINQVRSFHLL
ncbi:hypothetical protein ILYODFUR_019772 [Ilyodon furcidens]|uniref:Uncharacterized protein n=1 Tax=Ilyodon furcidens TaxID=33524 RepID=A0ABV0TX81_9TELE